MKKLLPVAVLCALAIGATTYLGYARPDAPPVPTKTYHLTVTDNKGFAQTIALETSDSFHIVTKFPGGTYDLSGRNEWTKDGMRVTAAVKQETVTPVAGNLQTVRVRSFATTLLLAPDGKPGKIGSSSGSENGKPEVYALTAALEASPEPTPKKP